MKRCCQFYYAKKEGKESEMSTYIVIIEKRKTQKAFLIVGDSPQDAVFSVMKSICPDKFSEFIEQAKDKGAAYVNNKFNEFTEFHIAYIGELKSTIYSHCSNARMSHE